MWLKLSTTIVLAVCCIVTVNCRDYLLEKPEFLQPCSIKAVDFDQCYKQNLQALISNLKNGISGLPLTTKLEPIKIRRLKIEHNQVKVVIRNAAIQGLSTVNLTKVIMHPKELSFLIRANVPKIRLDARYKIDSRVSVLSLNGSGRIWLETERLDFHLILKMQLRDDDNLTFIDVQSVESRIKHIGDFHINLENLFNGNKELETQTNALFNEHWRSFVEVVRPTIEDTLDAIVLARLRKIFYYIPAEYFISDVSVAKELYNNAEEIENKI